MTTILDGKKLRDKIIEELKQKVELMTKKPTLAVILAGDNPASLTYVKNKQNFAQKIGIKSEIIKLPSEISEENLIKEIEKLNNNANITAILVQLPLPKHISQEKVINSINPQKDADGFTPENFGLLFSGQKPIVYPCTPKGIMLLLDEYEIDVSGKHAVVIGRSNIVGKPMAQMLLNKNATVTLCHSYTKNLEQITKTADIIVCATGKRILTDEMIKENAIVIDVGIFRDKNGKLRGDVEYEDVFLKTSYITPVPGGVGPMTIASLMLNTIELFEQKK